MTYDEQDLPTASEWARLERCHRAHKLKQEAKRLGQLAHQNSSAAQRGTLIHAYLAGEPDEDGNEIVLSDSEQQTADFLQERMQGEVTRIFGDQPVQQLNEKRLWLVLNGRKVASGRFDRVVYTDTVALLQDAKTGWAEPVEAEQNSQLKFLAVLVALHMPQTLQEVVAQICSGPYGITEARYDRAALAKAWDEIVGTLKAIQAPDAPLTPGVEQCRYCPAIACCPAVKALVPLTSEAIALPDGARGAALLDSVEILQKRLDAIREHYAARLTEDPTFDLPGYAMIPGVVRREVTDWEIARQRLGEWLELDEINGAANYRLGDLEKALGRKLKLKGKEVRERMNTILQGLVEERQNSASLKRVKSKALVATE